MVYVGLPAYNEERRIEGLLMDIHKSLEREGGEYRIIVYDDGSTDETVSRVMSIENRQIKIRLIKGGKNRGLGHALSYLIAHCTKEASSEDTIIIMDADATHNPEHIHRMLGFIKDGFDVVIASRYTEYSRIKGVKAHRQLLSKAANVMFKLLFPIKGVFDYTCAYRAYTARILKLAEDIYKNKMVEERGFACMAELLIKLRKLEIIACEVPLILRYDRKSGPTKMNVIKTVLSTAGLVLKSFLAPGPKPEQLKNLKEKYNV